jgi:hypothetical protein
MAMMLKKMKAIRSSAVTTGDSLKETPINPGGLPSAEKTNGDRRGDQSQKPEETTKMYTSDHVRLARRINHAEPGQIKFFQF